MADEEKYKPDGQEEEEDEIDDTAYIAQKDAVLFAIDVSESMLQPPPASDSKKAEKDTAILAALKCAYQIMQQRIISQPKDMMGVLLFGTEQSKFQDEDPSNRGGLAYPHCYLLSDLDVPAASDVKALKSLVEDEEEAESLLVPTSEPVTMSNMLFCANQIFTTKAPNFGSRRLFIITNRDDPHVNDKSMRSAAAVRAKDLYDLGVIIELFPISQPDHEFDRTKFYDDIIYRDPSDPDSPATSSKAAKAAGSDGISLLQSLISNINSKQVAKRALFANLPFEIGPDFKISVKGYNILHPQKPARSCYVWLNGEKAQIASGETTQMAEDTARTISKTEIKKAYKFGGDSQVLFTPEEQKALKNFGPPGIRIIGFKPQSLLPPWASVHKSTFIYPSEEDYVGSTRVFSALQQKLLKDKKMGLAWYIARVNASPMLVAILPGEEKLDEDGSQVMPAGLWLYPLPYADDIRYPPEIPQPLAPSDELVDKMRIVVRQLQLPKAEYNPVKYPNPSLQWHYKILQALALEEEIPEEPEDKTIPRFKQIDKRAGAYVHDWGVTLETEYNSWVKTRPSSYAPVTGTKRKTDVKSDGAGKKIKKEDGSVDMKGLAKAGKVSSLKVAELKDWLATMGLDTTGRKDALVERIEEHFE